MNMPQNIMKSQEYKPTNKSKNVFSLGLITPLKEKNETENFFRLIEPLTSLNFSVKALSLGSSEFQEKLFEISEQNKDSFDLLESIPSNKQKIIESSQAVLFLDTPCKKDLALLAKNSTIAIIPGKSVPKDLTNFDAQKETGNCFVYDPENFWELLATTLRAYETFKFPYDWSQCRKSFQKTMNV